MVDKTVSCEVTVLNTEGLHMRPANLLVQTATSFKSQIDLIRDGNRADAKSILSVFSLAAEQGTSLIVEARGEDAQQAINSLVHLFQNQFASDQREQEESTS